MRPVPDATGDRYTLQPIGHEVHLLGERRGLNLARDDATQASNMGVTDLGLSARPRQIRLRLENSRSATNRVCSAEPDQRRYDSNRVVISRGPRSATLFPYPTLFC